jgi:hypothetical protein
VSGLFLAAGRHVQNFGLTTITAKADRALRERIVHRSRSSALSRVRPIARTTLPPRKWRCLAELACSACRHGTEPLKPASAGPLHGRNSVSTRASAPGVLPVLIRTAMVKGIAPPPVRTIGIVYTVLTGVLIYRRFDWPETGPMLTETASLASDWVRPGDNTFEVLEDVTTLDRAIGFRARSMCHHRRTRQRSRPVWSLLRHQQAHGVEVEGQGIRPKEFMTNHAGQIKAK